MKNDNPFMPIPSSPPTFHSSNSRAAVGLRVAAMAEIPLVAIGFGISWWVGEFLPPELAEFQENQPIWLLDEEGVPLMRALAVAYLLLATGCWIGGLIGLMRLRTWGAWVYVVSLVLIMPTYFVFGYEISHPIEQLYYQSCLMVSGAMLGLAFFSDALPWRWRQPDVER